MKHWFAFLLFFTFQLISTLKAEDGSDLWLRYSPVIDQKLLGEYKEMITGIMLEGTSASSSAAREELRYGLKMMLGSEIREVTKVTVNGVIVAGTPESSRIISSLNLSKDLSSLGPEGYLILSKKIRSRKITVITANTDAGLLYGVFHFLRLLQTNRDISALAISDRPKTRVRILNHWDNLNRSVERGYAGLSLWEWDNLPDSISPRYKDYARANASVGINGSVLTNVNANALILTDDYLRKVAAIADIFRPYNIKVYLTARFSAPIEIGKLKTADPSDKEVNEWWMKKADEIYKLIPDFGGFLVKANSEGQPGPQNYNRTHSDGANMLADAVAPHGGIVMWRAFVYDNNVPDDRAKQAYNEFVPLDGKFRSNVIIQVKNGPVDFQPREPFHPLFGAMTRTPVMPEFQITQEYLGASVHMVFLAPLFEECLRSDTYAGGAGTTVATIIDGTHFNNNLTAIAGVSNIGNTRNWTGHPFAQANWYAFGRLAWDPYLTSSEIAEEWIKMTFSVDSPALEIIKRMMLDSREIAVNYMTPLGLHHIMYSGHHYGPGPWVDRGRKDWTSVYYHRADSSGLGFNRTSTGSDAVSQYFKPVRDTFENPETCPENLLLWFHHLPWNYKLKSGNSLWEELCLRYDKGVKSVRWLQSEWEKTREFIDKERFEDVAVLLAKQERDAKIWRDGCVLYFQTLSKREFPDEMEKPDKTLDFYINHRYTDIPGISR